MSVADESTVRDWIIELYPADARYPYPMRGRLDIVRGEASDAISMLEGYAESIRLRGAVPRSLDWQNESPASVTRRVSPCRFAVRVDSFEFETDSGYSNGHGWLVAREADG